MPDDHKSDFKNTPKEVSGFVVLNFEGELKKI